MNILCSQFLRLKLINLDKVDNLDKLKICGAQANRNLKRAADGCLISEPLNNNKSIDEERCEKYLSHMVSVIKFLTVKGSCAKNLKKVLVAKGVSVMDYF